MEMTPGFLARSLAGNDKDKIYVITEDLGTYVSLLAETGRVLRKNQRQGNIRDVPIRFIQGTYHLER